MTGEEAVATLRGTIGSTVTIEVKREGLSNSLEFTLTREEIEVPAVPYAGLTGEGIGYLRLTRFSESAPKELAEALTFLQTQNPKGIILDLRSNPGGLLGAAVEAAGLFLGGEKLVVETRGRRDEQNKKYKAGATALCPDLPLVVVVDEYTASAAEIVAGAVQDWDRGLVIGRPTFGKGLVQTPIDLPNGAALKLTTARYYIPSGRTIQRPDRARTLSLAEADSAPDSSAHQIFHTKGGRTVYGMGGVAPDLVVERTPRTPVEVALIPYFFDFAVYYLSGHPEVPADFTSDAAVLAQFKKFLAEKKFSYQSQTEEELALLEGKAVQEGFSLSLRQAIRALRGRINKEKEQALAGESEFISWQIKEQVLGARYGEKAIYQAVWLRRQPELLKAREILTRSAEYRRLLALDSGQKDVIGQTKAAR
jgi:carboxyl-terminal processing protease